MLPEPLSILWGKFEYIHNMFKFMIIPYFTETLGLSPKVENIFLLHPNLSYSRCEKYFMTLFGTSPQRKISSSYCDCRKFE